jgi:hypothetical protein
MGGEGVEVGHVLFRGPRAAGELNSSLLLAFNPPLTSSIILYIVSFLPAPSQVAIANRFKCFQVLPRISKARISAFFPRHLLGPSQIRGKADRQVLTPFEGGLLRVLDHNEIFGINESTCKRDNTPFTSPGKEARASRSMFGRPISPATLLSPDYGSLLTLSSVFTAIILLQRAFRKRKGRARSWKGNGPLRSAGLKSTLGGKLTKEPYWIPSIKLSMYRALL